MTATRARPGHAETNRASTTTHLTATGYDASGNVVATDNGTFIGSGASSVTPQIRSTTNNVKSFTIATDDLNNLGLGFSNIAGAAPPELTAWR